MRRFRRLLVGVDLTPPGDAVSPGSRRAALQAQWLAEKTGASLTLFHSTWTDIYEDGFEVRAGPGPEGMASLEELRETYDSSGIPTELVLSGERAWVEMIRRVQRGENDLVIVARRSAAGHRALGSTSKKLMRKCPAPVWVVKGEAKLLYEAIAAATDLTPVGDRAVELAAALALAFGCALHVIHAVRVPLAAQMSAGWKREAEHPSVLQKRAGEAERHILAALRESHPEAAPILHVGSDSPSRFIRETVASLDADLLVMGTVSRAGIAGMLVGNTAERLLDRLECALLTIKPRDFLSPVGSE
ncbi:MAG: universal stress protein [Planctomycetota bacterium]